jgi:hypothetical protein
MELKHSEVDSGVEARKTRKLENGYIQFLPHVERKGAIPDNTINKT